MVSAAHAIALERMPPSLMEYLMNPLLQQKIDRAAIMLEHIAKLDAAYGRDVPARSPQASMPTRLIVHGRFVVHCYADVRIATARLSEKIIGEKPMDLPGCTAVEIKVHGVRVLVVNIYQGRIELYLHKPGDWECELGTNPGGDTLPILPGVFVQPNCPQWQAFKDRPEALWPPRHGDFGVMPTKNAKPGSSPSTGAA